MPSRNSERLDAGHFDSGQHSPRSRAIASTNVALYGFWLDDRRRTSAGRSRRAAGRRLDLAQSASGLILVLFLWGHMFFVSSILFGKDAMWTITKFFEGYYFFGVSYPWIVSIVVALVIALFVAHALLAMRKFPIDYRQFATYRTQMRSMRHETPLYGFGRRSPVLRCSGPVSHDADAPRSHRSVRIG